MGNVFFLIWVVNFLYMGPLQYEKKWGLKQFNVLDNSTLNSYFAFNHCFKLLNSGELFSYGIYFKSVIPCLEFSIEFQSNNLIYQKEYTKREQIIYFLIKHLHDRGSFDYQKISQWLNKSGIKTYRGKKWFNSSVISVLKRKPRI